eukprot:scaffold38245_cov60-Phaeocystis_antarctica.AAC.1
MQPPTQPPTQPYATQPYATQRAFQLPRLTPIMPQRRQLERPPPPAADRRQLGELTAGHRAW